MHHRNYDMTSDGAIEHVLKREGGGRKRRLNKCSAKGHYWIIFYTRTKPWYLGTP